MRPLLPDDEAFENMFESMSLDIDCKNQENLPVVDNSLTSGINGVLIKVFMKYFFLEVFEQITTIGNFYMPTLQTVVHVTTVFLRIVPVETILF